MKGIQLVGVYKHADAKRILFDLLAERDPITNISHRKMPTWSDHIAFVDSKPYRKWYLIQAPIATSAVVSWDVEKKIELAPGSEGYRSMIVGACYLTRRNEVGVAIFRQYQRQNYGIEAVNMLIIKHKPLPGKPGERESSYVANINPANIGSMRMFEKIGFTHIQNTLRL